MELGGHDSQGSLPVSLKVPDSQSLGVVGLRVGYNVGFLLATGLLDGVCVGVAATGGRKSVGEGEVDGAAVCLAVHVVCCF